MGLDPISFVTGALAGAAGGAGITYAVLRQTKADRKAPDGDKAAASPSHTRVGSARTLYNVEMASFFEHYHLAGKLFPLTRLLVEPRLLLENLPLEDDELPTPVNPSRVIPRIHDFPEVYASFNLEFFPITDLNIGEPHIAILGQPGMGKSTALVALGLMTLGRVRFNTMQQLMDQVMEAEYEGLSEAEREKRKLQFEQVKKHAAEQLRKVQQRDEEAAAITRIEWDNFFPIFVHIGDIDLDLNIYGLQVDSAEPIVQAYKRYFAPDVWEQTAYLIYEHLDAGNALVLIDGYDDLTPSECARVYPWLEQFMQDYGQNRVVMTGPATGYDALIHTGFTPVFIRPWTKADIDESIRKWVDVWQPTATPESKERRKSKKSPDEPTIEPKVLRRLQVDNHHRTALEITLKTWSAFEGQERELGRRGWFESFVRRLTPELEQMPLILREIAMVMLDRGIALKQEQITEIASGHLTDAEDKPVTNIEQVVTSLVEKGLMVRRAENTLDFCHPLITAYLGGERLIHDMSQRLPELSTQPNWQSAVGFAAAVLDLTPAVIQKLRTPPDLLFSNLFSISRWLPDAPANSNWRNEILKKLAAALLAPAQFPTVRERALAALVASRDQNLIFVLRQGVRSGNPILRQLACIGLGALGYAEAVKDLAPMLVDDDAEVQLAAGQSLGAIGSDEALKLMVQGLTEGEDTLRQAIAESLAFIPGEGHNILRDAIVFDDLRVRRAAVFGLARIPAGWSLVALYRAMLEDTQWYVRSAAEQAFMQARDPDRDGIRAYPMPSQLPWLTKLAAEMGEGVPEGTQGIQMVVRVLQESAPKYRVRAADVLGKIGHAGGLKPLYAALADRDESVRIAAYNALGELQMRVNTPLPGLI